MTASNKLYFGDNLKILRDNISTESVDLIYLDPPFNSKADYNVLYKTTDGRASAAQTTAFKDTWTWDEEAAKAFHEIMTSERVPRELRRLMESLKIFLTGDIGNRGNSLMAYLTMMALRLIELHRVLKPTGSMYLHCDPNASHYLKVILDSIFGFKSFRNEIIWLRHNARSTAGKWPQVHDTLLFYSKGERLTINPQIIFGDDRKIPHTLITGSDGKKYQTYELTGPGTTKEGQSGKPWRGFDPSLMGRHWANSHELMDEWDSDGLIHWPKPGKTGGFPRRRDSEPFDPSARTVTVGSVWTDIDRINQSAKERLGYPTQKPEALLERILKASSKEGDTILDPFCGCGTSIAVAERLKRNWIGIDVTYLAVDLMERRLLDMFSGRHGAASLANIPVQKRRHALKAYWGKGEDELGIGLRTGLRPFEVLGVPHDLDSARFLFQNDPFQFEWWCVAMVGAQGRERKGADKGIDGLIHFQDKRGEYRSALVSVKGGQNIKREMVATLKGDMQRERAASGILITLENPTGPMRKEAADAGRWNSELNPDRSFPVIQILTVEDILKGAHADLPTWGIDTFKAARKVQRESGQDLLEL